MLGSRVHQLNECRRTARIKDVYQFSATETSKKSFTPSHYVSFAQNTIDPWNRRCQRLRMTSTVLVLPWFDSDYIQRGKPSAHAAVQVVRATSLSGNLNGKLFLARPLHPPIHRRQTRNNVEDRYVRLLTIR